MAMPTSASASVVEAVADHCHLGAVLLQPLHFAGLVLRQHLGEHLVDAGLAGDGVGAGLDIAGDHDHPQAALTQPADRLGGVVLDAVGDAQHADHPVVAGQEQRRGGVLAERGGLVLQRQGDPFLLQPAAVAQPQGGAVEPGADALAVKRLEVADRPR
jgi:hypothetical protein